MTDQNLNQNSDTKLPSIEAEKGKVLKAIGREFTGHGVTYFIQPLKQSVIVSTSLNSEMRDIIQCLLIIPANQNFLNLQTNIVHPLAYKDKNEKEIEGWEYNIPDVGDGIAQIIQILD